MTDAEIVEGLQQMLGRHLSQLSEHFSSVQIIASKVNPDGGTSYFSQGAGDWYARQGLAQRFIKGSEAGELAWEISKVMPQKDNDD